ncbi:MAG: hypothetical protein GY820_01465 [Gammaproteobacteria bacterium]|nr:hypothetical protein [Gammaproteobacteria bacterium]
MADSDAQLHEDQVHGVGEGGESDHNFPDSDDEEDELDLYNVPLGGTSQLTSYQRFWTATTLPTSTCYNLLMIVLCSSSMQGFRVSPCLESRIEPLLGYHLGNIQSVLPVEVHAVYCFSCSCSRRVFVQRCIC